LRCLGSPPRPRRPPPPPPRERVPQGRVGKQVAGKQEPISTINLLVLHVAHHLQGNHHPLAPRGATHRLRPNSPSHPSAVQSAAHPSPSSCHASSSSSDQPSRPAPLLLVRRDCCSLPAAAEWCIEPSICGGGTPDLTCVTYKQVVAINLASAQVFDGVPGIRQAGTPQCDSMLLQPSTLVQGGATRQCNFSVTTKAAVHVDVGWF
jgi:hypothetical protein